MNSTAFGCSHLTLRRPTLLIGLYDLTLAESSSAPINYSRVRTSRLFSYLVEVSHLIRRKRTSANSGGDNTATGQRPPARKSPTTRPPVDGSPTHLHASRQPTTGSLLRSRAFELAAFISGPLLIGVAIYGLLISKTQLILGPHESIQSALEAANGTSQNFIYADAIALTGIIVGTALILLAAYRVFEIQTKTDVEEKVEHIESALISEFKRGRPVKLVAESDDIWIQSIAMLDRLSHNPYRDRHAYDVTSFLNRLAYEEAVARVVSRGTPFQRVFAYKKTDSAPSDLAVKYLFDAIMTGEFDKTGLEDEVMAEFSSSLKERAEEVRASRLETSDVERIESVVRLQHLAMKRKVLRVKAIGHRMPIDFVAIEYDDVTADTDSKKYEVMANFKTEPELETYVVGTYATGKLASGYVSLFREVISKGFVE